MIMSQGYKVFMLNSGEHEILKEVAIDSRLSPAKVRWRQRTFAGDSQLKYMDGIVTKILK